MPIEDFFARWGPAFARQASSTQDNARRQAEADTLIAKAEYEFFDVQRELMAAFDVPLRHRAIKVADTVDGGAPTTHASDDAVEPRASLAARLASAAAKAA